MSTKDPHVAFIDAQEELHQIKLQVKAAIALLLQPTRVLTEDDKTTVKIIRQQAIDGDGGGQRESRAMVRRPMAKYVPTGQRSMPQP